MVKRLWKRYRWELLALVGIVILYGVMFSFGISCPVKWLTGISCPGCGMTRACLSALTLQFSQAFAYHPLWVTLPFLLVGVAALYLGKRKKAAQAILMGFVGVMIVLWIYRICFCDGDVVVFRPWEGAVARGIRWVFSRFL